VSLASAQPESWAAAVVELAADGTVDRQRVLDATLDALGRDFAPYRAGWFSRLHTALRPTTDEAAARQPAYANLLRSPVGPTRTLAVDALVMLDKAGRLDDAVVAGGLAAAVHATAKSTAVKAVRLLARIAERGAGSADAIAAGLGSPHADVQAAALAELRRLDGRFDGRFDAAGLARPYVAALAPAVAREAAAWLGAPPVRVTPRAPAAAGGPPAPAPVAPIGDPDELAEALAVLLENPGDGELAERCLAALARLGPDPDRYRSLARRAGRLARDDRGLSHGLYEVLADLVLAAAGEPEPRWTRPSPIDPVVHLLAERTADVARALRAGPGPRSACLAAAPTHTGGWIEPGALVERLLAAPPAGPGAPAGSADAVAALLRLGPRPDDPAALAAAAPVRGVFGAALRYALGGPPPNRIARRAGRTDLALWVAAARARAPYGDDAPLIAAGHDEAGLGRAPGWRVATPLVRDRDPYPAKPTLELHGRDGARYAAPHPLLPTAAQAVEGHGPSAQFHGGNYLAWYPWAALTWPGNPSAPLATGLRRLHEAILGIREPVAAQALDLVATTAARLPGLAPHVLAFGFGSAFAADRTRAVDAALSVLPHRLTPADLGAAMAVLAPFVPVNRWTGALGDLAAAGREAEVVAVLAAFLPAVDRTVRGLHGPVELLRDLRLTGRAEVRDGALRAWLATTAGNSKLAKAAQATLAP
jgi:hypothetical protein